MLTLVPGGIWVWFFYRQDSAAREPIGRVLLTFGFGMLAVLPAARIEAPFRELLTNPPHPVVHLLLMIALVGVVEEVAKFSAFYLAAYRSRELDEPVDGVIYGSIAGVGFATLENILYAVSYGMGVVPVRGVIATLAHASFSGLAGYYAARVKLLGAPRSEGVYGVLLAAVLHGLYNFVVLSGALNPLLVVPMVYLVYRHLARKTAEARLLRLR